MRVGGQKLASASKIGFTPEVFETVKQIMNSIMEDFGCVCVVALHNREIRPHESVMQRVTVASRNRQTRVHVNLLPAVDASLDTHNAIKTVRGVVAGERSREVVNDVIDFFAGLPGR